MKKRKTKRWISGMTAAVMLGTVLPMAVLAEQGQWPDYQTPVYPETGEGVTVDAELDSSSKPKTIKANVIIGESVTAEEVAVDVSEALDDVLQNVITMPGSKYQIELAITNNSAYPYDYKDGSAVLGTVEYTGKDIAGKASVTTFEGFKVYLGSANDIYRTLNDALKAIGITNSEEELSDTAVSGALQEAGYTNGIEDLDDYYVNYYNDTYDEDIQSLAEAPNDYLKVLFGKSNTAYETIRESNPDVAAMGYYYFYNHLFTIDGHPLAGYMKSGSPAYEALNAKLSGSVTLQPGESATITSTALLNGPDTTNTYADYSIVYGFAFSMVQGKPKTDYPSLDKTIITPDGNKSDHDDVAAGDTVHFQLESNVPNDIINYMMPEKPGDPSITGTNALVPVEKRGSYPLTFHDDLNQMFVNPMNFVVKIGDDMLSEDLYTLRMTPGDSCDFEIALDLIKLYDMGYITDQDIEEATPITVEYDATLSTSATAGTYENTAWVTYPGDESEKDIVQVDTYALDIYKYDQANPDEGLAGAEFTLTGTDGTTYTATTGTDGHARIEGLDAGTYTLTETKAPEGYVKSDTPLTIEIPEDTSANVVSVQFANSEIPHTGGMGTTLFTIGGAAIIVGAGIVFAVTRKRKKVND